MLTHDEVLKQRYPERTVTLRDLPKPLFNQPDPAVIAKAEAIQKRHTELTRQLSALRSEINTIRAGLGKFVYDGGDYKAAVKRLAELDAEAEALDAGITYAGNILDNLRRGHNYLR